LNEDVVSDSLLLPNLESACHNVLGGEVFQHHAYEELFIPNTIEFEKPKIDGFYNSFC